MNFKEDINKIVIGTLTVLILVLISIFFLDIPLADWLDKNLNANAPFVNNSNIPDLLDVTVVILTSLSWGVYFYLVSRKIQNQNTLFCQITGTVLPLSMGIKIALKWFFGRIETRTWLSNPGSYGFHWFNGMEGFEGFPSGHMLVLTSLLLTLWHFYPRYRLYYGIVWLCLGTALIVTEYHFLSDVIAGACIGGGSYLTVSSLLKVSKLR